MKASKSRGWPECVYFFKVHLFILIYLSFIFLVIADLHYYFISVSGAWHGGSILIRYEGCGPSVPPHTLKTRHLGCISPGQPWYMQGSPPVVYTHLALRTQLWELRGLLSRCCTSFTSLRLCWNPGPTDSSQVRLGTEWLRQPQRTRDAGRRQEAQAGLYLVGWGAAGGGRQDALGEGVPFIQKAVQRRPPVAAPCKAGA